MVEKVNTGKIRDRGGTEFYRRRVGDWLRRYAVELLMLVVILVFATTTAVITTTARHIFREAKDIRAALRAVGTEYYGNNSCIYDPNTYNGLAEGASERIETISTHDGEVYLYSWNEEDNTPLRFEYRKGLYTVVYVDSRLTADPDAEPDAASLYKTSGSWNIYYSFNVLKYETE